MLERRTGIGLHAAGKTECLGSFYRARYYDPVRSRFISEDPIGLENGINYFAYVNNRPSMYYDPMGLQAVAPAIPGVPLLPPYPLPAPQPLTPEQVEQMKEDLERLLDPRPLINYIDDQLVDLCKSFAEHKRKKPSTWDKHSKPRPGDPEKSDERRRPPRQKPPEHKGPWPPKDQ